MRPIIGISTSENNNENTLSHQYVKAVTKAGGIPVILPNIAEHHELESLTNMIDGLLLSGGGDIDPTFFGEEPHPKLGLIRPNRDEFEMYMIKDMLRMDKPILAICRGCQILNIAAGGDMFQDIYSQIDEDLLQHTQVAPISHGSHFVHVKEGSLLHQITKVQKFKVNSFHHQANRHIATGFQISGTASDGIIESIESTVHSFVLGLQWHPEGMLPNGDQHAKAIFQSFLDACKKS
ncbi:gamma-glutamyl-gamma-aminobutyrate hydrolase family protein [Alkalihalobacillus sp. MEB130]|uniref:gamma-glutamyl-gamma-aminobutyrate hydrolase family protein n=1 Tax=Alkalihalobacillus sp. MEB130 TaxID=2976704 RepID=UPI0028E0525A|nr:gamma-glutamyl-gamma-aminobutyrate hydrolase family protein [Alkalihalobacillus sp. MEB130]MDT8859773.1 gamma-glutamyl-gamma-aminobutyrate hydrolase family protein [Alkalihalobacillus sp. MEB130]